MSAVFAPNTARLCRTEGIPEMQQLYPPHIVPKLRVPPGCDRLDHQ